MAPRLSPKIQETMMAVHDISNVNDSTDKSLASVENALFDTYCGSAQPTWDSSNPINTMNSYAESRSGRIDHIFTKTNDRDQSFKLNATHAFIIFKNSICEIPSSMLCCNNALTAIPASNHYGILSNFILS